MGKLPVSGLLQDVEYDDALPEKVKQKTESGPVTIKLSAPDRWHFTIVALEPSLPYELGSPSPGTAMYPAYIRGLAYLAQRYGAAAVAEFQKFPDHSGLVANFLLGSLAHLQLARAYAQSGDSAKAKGAYQDFLGLWKDADPDIPILKEAKAEYAKLQGMR